MTNVAADLSVTLAGQARARADGDLDALALWSRRRVAILRLAYPLSGLDGPWPVPRKQAESCATAPVAPVVAVSSAAHVRPIIDWVEAHRLSAAANDKATEAKRRRRALRQPSPAR